MRSLANATVLDAVGTTLLSAEMMINLRTRCGLGPGRRWAYAKAPAHLVPPVKVFED